MNWFYPPHWRRLISLYLVLILWSITTTGQEKQPLIIPDVDTYGEFLIGEWDSQKPVLVTFKDPHCPYCVKALRKIERLDNYNVFLFWSPILGQRSINSVNGFFSCDSPSGEIVIEATKKGVMPACSGIKNTALQQLNSTMVANYNPRSVPQYWMGGRKLNVTQLKLAQSLPERIDDVIAQKNIVIPWARYSDMAITPAKYGLRNIALVMPNGKILSEVIKSSLFIDDHFRWYVVDDSQSKTAIEFKLLTNLVDIASPTFVLEGKVLNDREMDSLLPDEIIQQLAL